MPIPISATVLDALGQSFVREEGLGNYRLARQRAEQQLQKATDTRKKAEACFSLGVVHLLRGHIRRALQYWDQAEAIDYQDVGLHLLLSVFRQLADNERWNTKLDGSASESIEVLARWDTDLVISEIGPQLNALRENCPDLEAKNLAWYLSQIVDVGKNARSTAERWQAYPFTEKEDKLFWRMIDNMEWTAQAASEHHLSAFVVFPHLMRADILHRAGFTEKATAALQQAEANADRLQDEVRQALCLFARGDWLSATFSTVWSWDFALRDNSQESSTLDSTIELQEFPKVEKKVISQAKRFYRRAMLLLEAADAKRGLGQGWLRLAYLDVKVNEWGQAATSLQQAESLFRETEDYRGLILVRTYQVLVHLWQGYWNGLSDQARLIGRWGRWSGDFSFVQSLGILINRFARYLFLRHGRYEASRIAYQCAQALYESLQAPINATQNIVDQALLHEAVGDFTTATPELKKAADRYMELAQNPPAFWSLPKQVYPFLIQHAVMLAAKGYNISNGLMDGPQMARFQRQLTDFVHLLNPEGTISTEAPTNPEAIRVFQLSRFAEQVKMEANILIPYYQFKQEDHKDQEIMAHQYWEAAYQALDQMSEDRVRFFEAVLWGAIRQYDKATIAFQQHLDRELSKFSSASGQAIHSGIIVHQEDLERLRYRHLWEHAFKMWTNLQQYHLAEAAWNRRCALEDNFWWEKDTAPWSIGCTVAEMFEHLGQYEQATFYCRRSLELLDERRSELSRDELKTAIANDRGAQFLYHQGARLSFLNKKPEEAFFYIEQGKARALLDLLSARPDQLPLQKNQRANVRQWRESNAKLQALRGLLAMERRSGPADDERPHILEQEIAEEVERLIKLETELTREIPAFFSTIGGAGEILDIPALQQYLEPGQLFVGYSYYKEDLFIWAINQNGLVSSSWQKRGRKELSQLAVDLHQSCQHKSAYTEVAEELARILLHPITESLQEHNQIYLAPSGSLYLLPFHTLPLSGRPLGDTHILSFLPSASALQYFQPVSLSEKSQLLVIGNPTGDLQAAEAEATFVARLFETNALLSKAATEAAVRRELPKANILHLATHGYLSEEVPLASALALADNAQISLYELMGMQLAAELVVLSACETGKGTTTSGDDVLGLTRGLLAAGVKSAVVSFWSVDDASTALFMQYFYEHLKKERSPAKALAFAQRKLRQSSVKAVYQDWLKSFANLPSGKQRHLRGIKLDRSGDSTEGYTHPFYWAPFFYVGRL